MNKLTLALAALMLSACAPKADKPPAAAPTDTMSGGNIEELLAREQPEMDFHDIASEDGFFTARVEGVAAPTVEKHEHGYYLAWDIGTRAPMECTVFAEAKDLAASTLGVTEVFFEEATKSFGELEARAVAGLDAGAFGAHPWVRVDWVYRTNRGGEKLAGLFKLLFADVGETTAQCMHNEIGYNQTFTRVSHSLITSLATERKSETEMFYTDVYAASINGKKIGVMQRRFGRDRDGDVAVEIKGATLFPAKGQIVGSLDIFGHEYASTDGALLGSVRVSVEDGKLVTNLKLQRTEDGGWIATGLHKGAEVNEPFTTPEPLTGELAQILALRTALAAGDTRIELTHYSPSTTINAPTTTTFTLTGRDGDTVLGTMTDGSEVTRVRIDARGMVSRQETDLGGAALVFERVHQSGEI